jgi:hypothetical protein
MRHLLTATARSVAANIITIVPIALILAYVPLQILAFKDAAAQA